MFSLLQTAADVLAPPATPLQDFEYHWKHVKNFYASVAAMPKVHISHTNLAAHLEKMLDLLIQEESASVRKANSAAASRRPSTASTASTLSATAGATANPNASTASIDHIKLVTADPCNECFQFVVSNRPLDLLADICIADSPPGATVCILNWMRRFLSCLQQPHLEQKSIFEPILKLVASVKDGAGRASPYELEEMMFLLTVAGVVRKDPLLLNLFLPKHLVTMSNTMLVGTVTPRHNSLFDGALAVTPPVVELVTAPDAPDTIDGVDVVDRALQSLQMYDGGGVAKPALDEGATAAASPAEDVESPFLVSRHATCDCAKGDTLALFDTIVQYFDSADSLVVVRACEAALVLVSLPSIAMDCRAVDVSMRSFCTKLAEHVGALCQAVPEDMDAGDIEDCSAAWGLLIRDEETVNYIGRSQLTEFLCWLDYANCVAKECASHEIAVKLADRLRTHLFENAIEPAMIEPNLTAFALVLSAKVVNRIDAKAICDQLALWLVGPPEDGACVSNDCLLNILIENAQDNTDILLQTLQFVEALLNNAHELILHSMLFRYLTGRGYFDANAAANCVKSWSDEEDERERRLCNATGPAASTTMRPSNILRVINSFLLLLPRQIMAGSIGTCYEEYVSDATRYYKMWLVKTADYNWPIDAMGPEKDDPALASPALNASSLPTELKSCDSGIAEEIFYEGPLLRLLFQHLRRMAKHPHELNLAVMAILSKLALLPHPYLHEVLLNPELPVARGTSLLWQSMQYLAKYLLLEIPRIEGFHKRIHDTAQRLLYNPPLISEIHDPLFESLVALEEFCKELAAIAFVKYHHAIE